MNKICVFLVIFMLLITTSVSLSAYSQSNNGLEDITNHLPKKQNRAFSSEIQIGNITSSLGKINVEIKNIGDEEANDIIANIVIEGGMLGFISKEQSISIESIDAGENIIIESDFLIGFGNINVEVSIDSQAKVVDGNIFLFFITINPEFTVSYDIIAEGFNSPLYATHAGDDSGRIFVVDQIGKIFVIENDELLSEPFLDISNKIVDLDSTYDERGLLGLAFHPDYKLNGRFFVYYSSPKSGEGINHETILAEYLVSDNSNIADPESEQIIYRIDQPEANHNGGQLLFGPDGYVYLGLGDGGGAGDLHGTIGNGQDINTALGSIIRIDVDQESPYVIPSDNPFVGTEGLDEIYAFGLRNPWRFSFDRDTDELFVADVGQDEWEEINILEKGGNYGWRILEGTHDYDIDLADELGIDISTLKEPIHEYSHSLGRSITGGYVYRGSEIPELSGKYVFGDWSSSFVLPRGSLFYLEKDESGSWQRFDLESSSPFNRFVMSFGEDESGELYVLSKTTLGPIGSTGDIRKISIE